MHVTLNKFQAWLVRIRDAHKRPFAMSIFTSNLVSCYCAYALASLIEKSGILCRKKLYELRNKYMVVLSMGRVPSITDLYGAMIYIIYRLFILTLLSLPSFYIVCK